MSHLALSGLTASPAKMLAFDDWTDQLQLACGSYRPQAHRQGSMVKGLVQTSQIAGVEVAQIANDIGQVRREADDIRRDYGENLFLLIQLQGSCGIEQMGRQAMISPGDCVLVDSSRPSIFHFGGKFCNHLSVHLPRQLLFAKSSRPLEMSRRVGAEDPMAVMLSALVAKLASTDAGDKRAPMLRQLLFDTTQQAFATEEELDQLPKADSSGGRLEIVQLLIDRHLTEENLTPRWLASKIGVSLRTLQEDFNELGETVTSVIRMRRLHLAREQLVHHRDSGGRLNIAAVAYSSGFNDISYFNRCFRQVFDCTPKDIISGAADGANAPT
jgi:AraC-like DNA-binding protein